MSVKMRRIVEKEICTAVVDALLKAGCKISVDNGDNSGREYEIRASGSLAGILKVMFQTDEERIYVSGPFTGWAYFVYGNDGWDVLSDYSVNLEKYIGAGSAVDKVIEKYSD